MTSNPTDPRPLFAAAGATALDVVSQVTPAALTASTPCTEFDVRALLGHMRTVLRRVTALGASTDPMAFPPVEVGVADEAWLDSFISGLADAMAAWADAAVLDRVMTLPWAEAPGRAMLPSYISELTVHTWDLAQALGYQPRWNPAVIDVSLVASRRLLPPGDRTSMTLPNGMQLPFANAVEISVDCAPLDHLVAWYGRTPV